MTKPLNAEFTEALVGWYRENCRDLPWRKDREPYHVWVSEIMLQQTRVEAVREYYLRFMKALPTIEALADADEQTLLKLWQGLGYYNRVRNMHKAAVTITENLGGTFPQTYSEILALSGIGEYTAGAIASICFDQRSPAVDGNVLRVMSRVLEDDGDIKSGAMKKRISGRLQELYPRKNCGEFTQGLIELGALICIPKGEPKCTVCPVREFCSAHAHGTAADFPAKVEKKPRKQVDKTVFILRCGDRIAVRRRDQNVLLAGLYEFPNVDRVMSPDEAIAQAAAWGTEPADLQRRKEYRHIFTHVEWQMTGYYLTVNRPCEEFQWVSRTQLDEEIPLPTAFGYFLL